MTFNCEDNQTVEIKIHNYQFPNSLDKEYDGNWLNIYLKVQSKVGHWQTIDPSLLTWEIAELINWFRAIADNIKPEHIEQEFIEPNISFYLLDNFSEKENTFKIKFDLESRPKSSKDDVEYSIIFKADKDELYRIANHFEDELKNFPIRK